MSIKKRRGHGKALIAVAKRLMTAIYYMLLRDEMYNPNIGKDSAPKRGKVVLEKILTHYHSKGYTITTEDGTVLVPEQASDGSLTFKVAI